MADCPGHEQYTRNMATGASTADAAVVLVDARKGLLTQTRRHSYIVSLLGIRHVVLAVNKMDLVGYDEAVFDAIAAEYRDLAASLGIGEVTAIPLSALEGDNLIAALGPHAVVRRAVAARSSSKRCRWARRRRTSASGCPCSGSIAPTRISAASRARSPRARCGPGTRWSRCRRGAAPRSRASSPPTATSTSRTHGQAVTLTLADELDISRGDVIADARDAPEVSDQFAAHLLWFDDAADAARPAVLAAASARATVGASVTEIKHKVDVNTQEPLAAKLLEMNEVGVCNLYLDQPVPFEAYRDSRELGAFILVDRQTNATVAAGTIDFALRRAANLHWQHVDVDQAARARIKGQRPRCVWFTGLSGSGKSTIANLVEKRLLAMGLHTYILDGDNVRHGLNKDLGFTDEDRVENIRRVAEVAKLMTDAGLIVLVSFISPFRAERRMARELFGAGEFVEVFVDTPLEVAESARREGPVREGARGAHPELHRHRFAVRGAGECGTGAGHHGRRARRAGRTGGGTAAALRFLRGPTDAGAAFRGASARRAGRRRAARSPRRSRRPMTSRHARASAGRRSPRRPRRSRWS